MKRTPAQKLVFTTEIESGNRTVTLNAGDDTLTAAAGSIERLAPAGDYMVRATKH